MDMRTYIKDGKQAIRIEAQTLATLADSIDNAFAMACETIQQTKGHVIVTGIGKSGHIAKKIAATFSSTGSPAFFVHPSEAQHGDLGMITKNDCVLAISYSGESNELLALLPAFKQLGVKLIAMTGNPNSTLAKEADCILSTHIDKEACPLNLAPTASTTASLAMGDALAIAVLNARDFQANDFAQYHPAGQLGRRLLLRVDKLMHQGNDMPQTTMDTPVNHALLEINTKRLGLTTVTHPDGTLAGIYTDGDIRRTLTQKIDLHSTPIQNVMSVNPKTIGPDMLADAALHMMHHFKITALVVVDNDKKPIGVLHMHDLLREGL